MSNSSEYGEQGKRWQNAKEAIDMINAEKDINLLRSWFPRIPLAQEILESDELHNETICNDIAQFVALRIAQLTENMKDFMLIHDLPYCDCLYEPEIIDRMISLVKTKEDFNFVLVFCEGEQLEKLHSVELID